MVGRTEDLKPMPNAQSLPFREAKRTQQSFLAAVEKKTLLWLAARTPAWINSDHLTALGLAAMAGAGAGYWWSRSNRLGLIVVIICLALNWLGDSLDGTLARFRNCQRPRYGFYVDHVVDAFSTVFLLGGLALSGYMSPWVAVGLLITYLVMLIEVCLATYTLGEFTISYFKMGPTELRILLSVGNLVLFWKSMSHIAGRAYRLFDVAGSIGIAGMLLVLLISVAKNTLRLYRREPLPEARRPERQVLGHSVQGTKICTSVLIFAACLCLRTPGLAQSASSSIQTAQAGESSQVPSKTLDKIDPGTVAGHFYFNTGLGFSYEFPAEWHVVDPAHYQNRVEVGHQNAFGDDPEAARAHEGTWRCMRALLWALEAPEGSKADVDRTASVLLVGAADPGCFQGHTFPANLDDVAAVRDMEDGFTDGQLFEGEKKQAKAYEDQGHVILEVSGSIGNPAQMYGTIRLASAGDYWLFWMLMADSEEELSKLKDLKTTFVPPVVESSEKTQPIPLDTAGLRDLP
jgi:archaetidylinositol phosphate synthase